MKNARLTSFLVTVVFTLCTSSVWATHLPLLPHPNANELCGPVFIQPFAGLTVVSVSGGIGETDSFFSDLPDGFLCNQNTIVVNLLGNFQAFDDVGNSVPFGDGTGGTFDIVGVKVDDTGTPFTPAFGNFDFAGKPSITFNDSVDLDQVTFSSADFTLAFKFTSDTNLDYSYKLFTVGLPVGSVLVYDDVQTGTPEPSTIVLLATGFAVLAAVAWRRRRLHHAA